MDVGFFHEDASGREGRQHFFDVRSVVEGNFEAPGRFRKDLRRNGNGPDPGVDLVERLIVPAIGHEGKVPHFAHPVGRDRGDVGVHRQVFAEDGSRLGELIDLVLCPAVSLDLDEVVSLSPGKLLAFVDEQFLGSLCQIVLFVSDVEYDDPVDADLGFGHFLDPRSGQTAVADLLRVRPPGLFRVSRQPDLGSAQQKLGRGLIIGGSVVRDLRLQAR